jgi:hypothetical protein
MPALRLKIFHLCLTFFLLVSCAVTPALTATPPHSSMDTPTTTVDPDTLPPVTMVNPSTSLASLQPPAGIDLDVTFISRDPLYYAYCVEYPDGIPQICPGREEDPRWPAQGEVVTFTAHVVNKGSDPSPAFGFAWAIDGSTVMTGSLPGLASGETISTTYSWIWAHQMDGERVLDDHSVRFTADPENLVPEAYENNNSLEDRTNALSLSMYITAEMYTAYNEPVDPIYPYSAEDWLQKQIAVINTNLAEAVYPATPQGATVRVRINTIEVTPTNPGYDYSHDGGWFVDADYRYGASAYYDPETDIDWGLVHELSHQMGLIDLYASNIYATNVFVLDQQGYPTNLGFEWPRPGIMGGGDIFPYTDSTMYDSHTAGGISSNNGYRNGYYGVYQYDIPLENSFQVLDNQGNPAPGVQVALYQRGGLWDWT